MEKELTPLVNVVSRRPNLEQQPTRVGIFSRTGTLNGIGVMAVDWVRTLETLTLRGELRFLTMLTWSEVLPPLRFTPLSWTYCPACYEEWRSFGQIIYETQLLALDVVTVFPRHQRRLHL